MKLDMNELVALIMSSSTYEELRNELHDRILKEHFKEKENTKPLKESDR